MKLQLGSGQNYKEGWINLDFNKDLKADVYHDLNKIPYPFKDNTFSYIYAESVIEHLGDTKEHLIKIIEELHRICKNGAIIEILVPHYTGCSALTHLTHKWAFGAGTFTNFEPTAWEKYSKVEFWVREQKLNWMAMRHYWWIKPINKIINWISNKNLLITERFLKIPFGGYDEISYKLEVVKRK